MGGALDHPGGEDEVDKGKLESCRCNEILELGHLLPPIAFRRPANRHGAGRGSTELACAGGGRARLPRGRWRGGGKGGGNGEEEEGEGMGGGGYARARAHAASRGSM